MGASSTSADILLEWLRNMVGGLLSHPEDLQIDSSIDDMGHLFVIRTHAEDRGKIIGKEGQHATALRALLRCAGSNLDVRAALKIDIPMAQKNK